MKKIDFKRVGIFGISADTRVEDTIRRAVKFFKGRAIEVEVAKGINDMFDAQHDFDLVISVGGDGTLLGAARALVEAGTPVFGINLGRLGFLADVLPQDLEKHLSNIIDGHYILEERFLLETRLERAAGSEVMPAALNDVVVSSSVPSRMIEIELYVDDKFIQTQRADGMIIATPTGSTAYSLSANGPIMNPGINAIALVPVCPHTLSSRPLVIDGDSRVSIRVTDIHKLRPMLFCDGREGREILSQDEVHIYKKEHKLHLLHPEDHDFYSACRNKLGWAQST